MLFQMTKDFVLRLSHLLHSHLQKNKQKVHSKLRSITPVATKVHMILQSFVVLTRTRDTIELV
jgi:hypothetical protein